MGGAEHPVGGCRALEMRLTSLTPALAPQLGLLGSPSDPVGRFTMREGPSASIVPGCQSRLGWVSLSDVKR